MRTKWADTYELLITALWMGSGTSNSQPEGCRVAVFFIVTGRPWMLLWRWNNREAVVQETGKRELVSENLPSSALSRLSYIPDPRFYSGDRTNLGKVPVWLRRQEDAQWTVAIMFRQHTECQITQNNADIILCQWIPSNREYYELGT